MASFDANDKVEIDYSADTGLLDSFGRIRSNEGSIIFSQHQSDDSHDFHWSNRLAGSGTQTYTKSKASIYLNTTTADGDEATRQSRRYFQYIPGQSMTILLTGKFDTAKTNLIQAMGFFDDNDGLFFRMKSTGIETVIRNSTSGSVVDTVTAQADWNIDKLDGTGDSGLNIDFTKGQVFVIDFQWLGYGSVRFGVMAHNKIIYCHRVAHINALDEPYMQRGSLPIRYTSYNDGVVASSSVLQMNCSSIIAELKAFVGDISRVVDNGVTGKAVNSSTLVPIIGLRLQSGFKGAELIPNSILTFSSDNNLQLYFQIVANPTTIIGASWTNEPNSIVQKDVSATSISGGQIIGSGYIVGKSPTTTLNTADTDYRMSIDINDVPDTIFIVARTLGGNGSCFGVIDFTEIF